MTEKTTMVTHHLNVPVVDDDLDKLKPGDVVYLNGVIYTAREGVYDRVLKSGEALPYADMAQVSNINFHCSPAASQDEEGNYVIGGVTATASFRFSKWMADWLDKTGTKIIIGKGGMPEKDYGAILAPRRVVYLTTVGYGTGALLGRGVVGVREVHWLDVLGIAQAMWFFDVRDFGPFLVDSDTSGRSLFLEHTRAFAGRVEELYQGLKPPALSRYGETNKREDEVM